ncbi:MAG: hypothetical protein MnENMB40S_05320 [Rhizobiaceae bacterium MnEN-MB40S]|nr:MAG: hypothetical protein MnENMB40S_05320 [Rhizobiaceae bacterium MnEN-MB40S]
MRLTATPHAIAAGVAAGVVASWTPFLGLHFVIAAALAYVIAGNIIASALGTAFGNPLTFPFIWTASYKLGNRIMTDNFEETNRVIDLGQLFRHLDFSQIWGPILKPMAVGCLPFALVFGVGAYLIAYLSVAAFQSQRRRRLDQKRTRRDGLSNGQTV